MVNAYDGHDEAEVILLFFFFLIFSMAVLSANSFGHFIHIVIYIEFLKYY